MFYIIGVNPNIERADRSLMEQIWIEKYRPNNLSEVVGQEAVTTRLKNYVKESSMPHLLFAGPAGIGKTTSALALARDCLLYTSPSPRDRTRSRMPSSA